MQSVKLIIFLLCLFKISQHYKICYILKFCLKIDDSHKAIQPKISGFIFTINIF